MGQAFGFGKKKCKICVVGLDNSGKTTILSHLKSGARVDDVHEVSAGLLRWPVGVDVSLPRSLLSAFVWGAPPVVCAVHMAYALILVLTIPLILTLFTCSSICVHAQSLPPAPHASLAPLAIKSLAFLRACAVKLM